MKYQRNLKVKPCRKTDYCRYCFQWRRMLAGMRPFIAKLKTRYGFRKEIAEDHLRKFLASLSPPEKARLSDVDEAQIEQYLRVLDNLEIHRLNARRQKEQYKKEVQGGFFKSSSTSLYCI